MLNSLRPGLQFNQYQLLEQIGLGGQAVVWSAEDLPKQDVVAIKFNEVPKGSLEEVDDKILEDQLRKLSPLRHQYILPIHAYGLVDQVRYLVSPYIAGGSLFEKLGQAALQIEDSLRYMTEIASALDFLHQNQIIHRDLKPSNVLMDLSLHTRLSDFGLARTVSNTTQAMHTGRGTPPYSPPEQHKLLVVTAKSDIYSFGVMLYELFTGQLPWNGEKMLGMQQLYTNIEMPDPCEVNPQLPPLLKDVLRRITLSDPALRPSSAGEVVKMINYVFNRGGALSVGGQQASNNEAVSSPDASILLDQKMADWNSKKRQILLDPTRFAIIQLEQKRKHDAAFQGPLAQFLLYHSISYNYHADEIWLKTSDPRDRASATLALLDGGNDVIAARAIQFLFKDQAVLALMRSKASVLAARLLELAFSTKYSELSSQLLSAVQLIAPGNAHWNDSALSTAHAALLGRAALADTEAGDQAIQLIAHLRSQSAIEFVTKNARRNRLSIILLEIQNAAGGLPSSVGAGIKTQIFLEWINQQLTTQPARLAAGYGLALFGSTLGIASHVYLFYRFPDFFDTLRIQTAIQQGLIAGFIFSLGIFLSRLIVERFESVSFLIRFGLASLVGTVGTSLALLLYHVLFLSTTPQGFLIPAGCFIIGSSFSLGRIIPWRAVKILLSTMAVFIAILATWWVHTAFSALTPLFQYEKTWTLLQVSLAASLVSIFIGVLGNLPSLKIREE